MKRTSKRLIAALLTGACAFGAGQLLAEQKQSRSAERSEDATAKKIRQGKAQPDRLGELQEFFEVQRGGRRPGRHEKDHGSALEDYEPVVAAARKSTAVVLDADGEQVALATVVSKAGYLVTKASELSGEAVTCAFSDGERYKARKLDVHERWDLALLKVDAGDLVPVKFAAGDGLELGTFLAASGIGEKPVAIGVASVAARNLSGADRGFLGIGMENDPAGIAVTEVRGNSGAAKAGLKIGDVIFEVEGKPVAVPAELAQAISGRRPEETVKIRYRRAGDEHEANATLGERPRRPRGEDRSQKLSGPLSENREDFPNALQHDLTLRPEECGGPLVNLDGHAVGVNVARGGRVQSYAIPAADLQALIGRIDSGSFALSDPADIEREAEAAKLAVDALEQRLQEARDRRKAAEEALRKLREKK